MPFLSNQLRQTAIAYPDRPALECSDRVLTYGQLYQQICAAGSGLQNSRSEPGDRIAVICNKSVETIVMLYACWASNRCPVLINPALRAEQVAHILDDSEACTLLTDAARYQRSHLTLAEVTSLREIILTDHSSSIDVPALQSLEPSQWESFITQHATKPTTNLACDAQSLACLLYTSGSTGLPKGVMVSHQNLYLGVKSVCQYLNCQPDDRILAALPLSFDYGLNQVTHALFAGATAVLYDYLLAGDLLQTLLKKSITGLAGIPTLWHAVTHIKSNFSEFPSLRYITNSGGKLSPGLIGELQKLFTQTQIYSMYGTTEAFRSTCLSPNEIHRRPASIGKPVPYAELHVLDENMSPCLPGTIGELVHAGPLVTLGYWRRNTVTQGDGYALLPKDMHSSYQPGSRIFCTGDLGYMDDAGYFYFSGRKDDMIKTSGFRVSPTEVEMIALQVEGVTQAVAIAHADEQLGQSIVLTVTSEQEPSIIQSRIGKWFQTHAPYYMRPRDILVIDHMPLTPNGKPDRNQLKQIPNTLGNTHS